MSDESVVAACFTAAFTVACATVIAVGYIYRNK
jgi:hypothetical protein